MKKLQREEEIQWMRDLFVGEGVGSYLEIGSKFGGSLDFIARSLPKGSRIVSVDLPGEKAESKKSLVSVIEKLNADGYDAHLILGDSTAPEIVEKVRALGPFDAVFIDANHLLHYVMKYFENFGPMGNIVAFHDIGYVAKPERPKEIEVPQFWNSIKGGYRHEECKLDNGHNGIGVLWN